MSTSKTGKHGHAKVHMVALDIFTGKIAIIFIKDHERLSGIIKTRSWRISVPPPTTWTCRW